MGRNQWEAGEGKKSAQKHIIKVHYMHVWKGHNEILIKICKKVKKGGGGDIDEKRNKIEEVKNDQSTLYACMEITQINPSLFIINIHQ
jgi:hypothetical protein